MDLSPNFPIDTDLSQEAIPGLARPLGEPRQSSTVLRWSAKFLHCSSSASVPNAKRQWNVQQAGHI